MVVDYVALAVDAVVVEVVIDVLDDDDVVVVGVVIVDAVTLEPQVRVRKGKKKPAGDREAKGGEKMLVRITVPIQNQNQHI